MTTFVSKQYGIGVLAAVPDVWPDLCMALLTGEPGVSGGTVDVTGVELTVSEYERQPVPAASWAVPAGNAPVSMLLDEDVLFAEASWQWPEVLWVALMPDANGSNALVAVELISPTVVQAGRRLRVAAGLLALRHVTM